MGGGRPNRNGKGRGGFGWGGDKIGASKEGGGLGWGGAPK